MNYKLIILDVIHDNACLDLVDNPFNDAEYIIDRFTNKVIKLYEYMFNHIKEKSYLAAELEDYLDEFDTVKDISYDDGFEYTKKLYRNINGFIEESDITDIIMSYIMILAYSRGYPKLQLKPFELCHCSIYTADDSITTTQFTRSMQTLFTIHALIYNKQDVNMWWNKLPTHRQHTFKIELQYILDNKLQYEYITITKYFDEFLKIYVNCICNQC